MHVLIHRHTHIHKINEVMIKVRHALWESCECIWLIFTGFYVFLRWFRTKNAQKISFWLKKSLIRTHFHLRPLQTRYQDISHLLSMWLEVRMWRFKVIKTGFLLFTSYSEWFSVPQWFVIRNTLCVCWNLFLFFFW